ncbi:MAG TPA: sensor histidine kinase KdpD [Cellulomonas sp.]
MDGAEAGRGHLTVYFGAAPGVGKTYAMLDEAHRRQARGTDVVVGLIETHGRPATGALTEGLEIVPRRPVSYRGVTLTELDVPALVERAPEVALVDELAHTNAPGSTRPKRWQDVEDLLAAGIDVITTVNVQHLESLVDAVEAITGVRQRETVPDEVVRAADQIQLVDLSPQALRRRLAHGNVYKAEQIDASLSSYFRVGNLTALRELALLWLADRVDDSLTAYRREHAIGAPWPARERIVVAVTGGPETDTLIRRGARLAQRSPGSELLAVHVLVTDGLPGAPPAALAAHRVLVESLGGTFHTVVGEDVATAVVEFSTGVNATMIVVGVTRRSRWRQALAESTDVEIARLAGSIDVHLVTHSLARAGRRRVGRASALSRQRLVAGWIAAVVLPAALTAALRPLRNDVSLPTDLMVFLTGTVGVALLGGLWPAVAMAVIGSLALNWFFTEPVGRFTIAEPENAFALAVFVLVAVAVASVVDLAARHSAEAFRSRAEASALAAVSRSVLTGEDTAAAVVERVRETFGQAAVALLERGPGTTWDAVASDGDAPPATPSEADTVADVDEQRVLALRGRPLPAGDRRALDAFASQAGIVLEQRRLRAQAEQARILAQADSARTALLAAVSHDLRTPLATIRASVDALTAPGLTLADDDRQTLVGTLAAATTRLERLIDNLLDMSRLQTGGLHPALRAASLEEVVPAVVEPYGRAVRLEVPEDLPMIHTDPGLLERVLDNITSNAVRHCPPEEPVLILASSSDREVEVRVVDRGPGVPEADRAAMFEPFRRLSDNHPDGVGLGLAVADGLARAVGAELSAEDTPGGGLTMVLRVPREEAAS